MLVQFSLHSEDSQSLLFLLQSKAKNQSVHAPALPKYFPYLCNSLKTFPCFYLRYKIILIKIINFFLLLLLNPPFMIYAIIGTVKNKINTTFVRGGAQWANFKGQVEIIIGLVSDNHLHLHVVMF